MEDDGGAVEYMFGRDRAERGPPARPPEGERVLRQSLISSANHNSMEGWIVGRKEGRKESRRELWQTKPAKAGSDGVPAQTDVKGGVFDRERGGLEGDIRRCQSLEGGSSQPGGRADSRMAATEAPAAGRALHSFVSVPPSIDASHCRNDAATAVFG